MIFTKDELAREVVGERGGGKCNRWLERELVDDHGGPPRVEVLGVAWRAGEARVRLVSCGPLWYRGVLSVNLVKEHSGRMHLTRTSIGMLPGRLVALLHDAGSATDGQLVVRAVEAGALVEVVCSRCGLHHAFLSDGVEEPWTCPFCEEPPRGDGGEAA